MPAVTRPLGLAKRKESKFELDLRKFKDGSSGSSVSNVFYVTALVDNTAFVFGTLVVPNFQQAGVVGILASAAQGDADGCEVSYNTFSLVRASGAATAVSGISKTNAVTAGATVVTLTISLGAVAGPVTGVQTIPMQVAVARTGGSSLTHTAVLAFELLNNYQGIQSQSSPGPGGVFIQ